MEKKKGFLRKIAVVGAMVGAMASPDVAAQAPTEATQVAPQQQEKQAIPVKETRTNRKQRRVRLAGNGGMIPRELRPDHEVSSGWSKQRRRREKAKARKAWLAAYAEESLGRYNDWKAKQAG